MGTSLSVAFGGNLFLREKDSLCTSQVDDDDSAGLYLVDDAGDYLPFPVLELGVDQFALHFPESLEHDLFGRLGGYAADLVREGFDSQFVPQDNVFLDFLSVLEQDLPLVVFKLVHHRLGGVYVHFSAVGVQLDGYVLPNDEAVLLEGRRQGYFYSLKHLLFWQVSLCRQLCQRYQKVAFHGAPPRGLSSAIPFI